MANDQEYNQILIESGAIIDNSHVVYTSWRHGSVYVNKDALYLHTQATAKLGKAIADLYDENQVEAVAGPAMGGVILSQWVAWYLSSKRSSGEVLSVYAEKESEKPTKTFAFHRGYDRQIEGKRILVVEDIITTGGSALKVMEAILKLGGTVIGLSAIYNRGNVQSHDVGGVDVKVLINKELDMWDEEDCPLCRAGIPINTDVGKGKAYLERKGSS
jgi:orotate phosphoribosyltransferase